jgi:hypothetical protein
MGCENLSLLCPVANLLSCWFGVILSCGQGYKFTCCYPLNHAGQFINKFANDVHNVVRELKLSWCGAKIPLRAILSFFFLEDFDVGIGITVGECFTVFSSVIHRFYCWFIHDHASK